jgi:hypothetical protein
MSSTPPSHPSNGVLRRMRSLALVLTGLVGATIGLLVLLATVYDAEVKERLIGSLNQYLVAPVTVSDMDLTLIARFPRASMRLNNVLAMEVRSDDQPPDTLFHAERLFLEFSLWDLFQGRYTVQEIHASNALARPALDRNGAPNYVIWRSDSTGTDAPIDLRQVSFSELRVRYRDDRTGLEVEGRSDALTLSGRFATSGNSTRLTGDATLLALRTAGGTTLGDMKGTVDLRMRFGMADTLFTIDKGDVLLGALPLELTMDVIDDPKGGAIDLRARSIGADLAAVAAALPGGLGTAMKRYAIRGEADLGVVYAGPLEAASLSLAAKIKRGRLKETRSGAEFSDVFAELDLEVGPKGSLKQLVVKDLRARSGSGSISGDWSSSGLKNAPVNAHFKADVALSEVLRFAQVDTLEQASGRLTADLAVKGRLRDMDDLRPRDLRALAITGTVGLRDASIKLKGIRHTATRLHADLSLNGTDATVQGLRTELQGVPITLSGSLINLMPYLLFDDQRLLIAARGSAPLVDIGAWVSHADATADDKEYMLTLPAKIDLDLQADVAKVRFEEFTATDLSARVVLRDRVLSADPVRFNSASGTFSGGLRLDGRDPENSLPLTITATCTNINVKQLFAEFQDFGQDFIGARHLSGTASAKVALEAPLSSGLKMNTEHLVSVIDITLENGSIKDHAPLLAVADHLEGNRLVAPFVNTRELRKRLADVRFARMENQLEIRDGAVHVPAMVVKSSALDLELSGTHWFDDRIDHHLNFRLSDLFRMGKPADDEFGPVADDGTGMRIFLHMHGTAGDPQFSNDGAMAAARRRQQLQEEKAVLRDILREELGLFKGRTDGDRKTGQDTDAGGGRIQFEEDDPPAATQRGKPRRGLERLLKDTTEPKEQARIRIED